jgi:hypothetical protein
VSNRRVLLVGLDRLLGDLVTGIVDGADGARVVAVLEDEPGLLGAVAATDVDFVIAAIDDATLREPYLELLERRPLVKVLAISDDGGCGTLWELRPERVPLGEVSPATLLSALSAPAWRNGAHR